MLIYWAYKYEIEDRDIGVVDYVSLQHSDDIPFPVLSICLVNPINEKKSLSLKQMAPLALNCT